MNKAKTREMLHTCAMEHAHAFDNLRTLQFFKSGGRVIRNGCVRMLTQAGVQRLSALGLPQATVRLELASQSLSVARVNAAKKLDEVEIRHICSAADRFYAVHSLELYSGGNK